MRGCAKPDGARVIGRASSATRTTPPPVRNQGAIATTQRVNDVRVLVRHGIAELEAQLLAHLGKRIADAVLVILGRNAREILRAVTVALKIVLCDPREDASKAAINFGLLLAVGRAQKDVADLRWWPRGHFLRADDKSHFPLPCLKEVEGSVDRCGARRAGVFYPHRRLVRQRGLDQARDGALKILFLKAVIHNANENPSTSSAAICA